MAATAILKFGKCAFLIQKLLSLADSQQSYRIWWELFQWYRNGSIISKFLHFCIFDLKVAFYGKFSTFSWLFGEPWFNGKTMAADIRNSRWRRPPSWNSLNVHFSFNSCVLWQIINIPIIFGEHWSNSEGVATHFRNWRWRRPPSWSCILKLGKYALLIWLLRSIADSQHYHQIWWGFVA